MLVEARLGNGMRSTALAVRPEDEYFRSGGTETRASVLFQVTWDEEADGSCGSCDSGQPPVQMLGQSNICLAFHF